MRQAPLAIVVASTMMFAGCVDFFTPSQGDIDDAQQEETGSSDNDVSKVNDPTNDVSTSGNEDTSSSDGPETTPDDSQPAKGNESEPGQNESEPQPPDVAPPGQQREDSPDELDRPGEYALLPPGNANAATKTSVPTWDTGSWWRHRTETSANTSCDVISTVTGPDTFFDVPVYRLDTERDNCDGREGSHEKDVARGAVDLMVIEDDGYIEHELVFPLEDGKRWRYVRPGNNTTTDVTLDYVPQYLWNTQLVPAWHATLDYSGDALRIEKWYGVNQKHYLREEVWITISGVPTLFVETDLIDYGS